MRCCGYVALSYHALSSHEPERCAAAGTYTNFAPDISQLLPTFPFIRGSLAPQVSSSMHMP